MTGAREGGREDRRDSGVLIDISPAVSGASFSCKRPFPGFIARCLTTGPNGQVNREAVNPFLPDLLVLASKML